MVAPWLLHLRFALEVAAPVAYGGWARRAAGAGVAGWVPAIAAPLVIAALWGTFAVPRDPTRSRFSLGREPKGV